MSKEVFDKRNLSCEFVEKNPRAVVKALIEAGASARDQEIHKDLLEQLIIKVSSQTREIEKKNKKLQELNKLKNEFLGIASHDLRNPIGSIKMTSELLIDVLNENLSSEQIEFLEEIKIQSKYMLSLLNELLDITAIESGKLELNLIKSNYMDFLEHVIKFNRPLAAKKDIAIKVIYGEPISEIEFDENKITQVINNFITNAVKFSYPHTKVTVSLKKEDPYIITTITDEGQGIPEREVGKIFKPFQKTSVKATAGETSIGLGLAITKKIIEGHGGYVGVESREGKGSSFFFSLPFSRVNEDEAVKTDS